MKKLLMGLGALGAIVTPIASVVACGEESNHKVLTFSDKMNKKQFEEEYKKYTDYGNEMEKIGKSDKSNEIKTKELENYYNTMPIFTFKLDGFSLDIDWKSLRKSPSLNLEKRRTLEEKLKKIAKKLGSAIRIDFL